MIYTCPLGQVISTNSSPLLFVCSPITVLATCSYQTVWKTFTCTLIINDVKKSGMNVSLPRQFNFNSFVLLANIHKTSQIEIMAFPNYLFYHMSFASKSYWTYIHAVNIDFCFQSFFLIIFKIELGVSNFCNVFPMKSLEECFSRQNLNWHFWFAIMLAAKLILRCHYNKSQVPTSLCCFLPWFSRLFKG